MLKYSLLYLLIMTNTSLAEAVIARDFFSEVIELSWVCEEMSVPLENSSKLHLDNFLWRKTRFHHILNQLEYEKNKKKLKDLQVRNKPLSEYISACRAKIHAYHKSLIPSPQLHLKSLNDELLALCHRMNSLHMLGTSSDEFENLTTLYHQKLKEVRLKYPSHEKLYSGTLTHCEFDKNVIQEPKNYLIADRTKVSLNDSNVGIVVLLRKIHRGLITERQSKGKSYRLAEDEFFMLTNILDDILIYVFLDSNETFWTIAVRTKPGTNHIQGSLLRHNLIYMVDQMIVYQHKKIILFKQKAS